MMISMSAKAQDKVKSRVTITVDPDVLALVQAVVADGGARSVSAFFENAALGILDADLAYERMLSEMLQATGGPLTPEEIEETDRELGYLP